MRRSSQFSLSSATKRSLAVWGAALFVALALGTRAIAATPVDVYQDMESGDNGNVLTAALMNASTHPTGTPWGASSGTMWVSTSSTKYHSLPGPVIVGGVTYNGTGGSRTWVNNNNNNLNYVEYSTWGTFHPRITVACFYNSETTIRNTTNYDVMMIYGQGGMYSVMQDVNGDGNGPYFECHSKDSANNVTVSGTTKITAGKTYWVNMKYDGPGLMTSLAVFDPDASYAQVGSTMTAASGSDVMYDVRFGRVDAHSNMPSDTTQAWWGNILIDWTNAAFPLIPSAGTDSTPPSAPGNVRDGTGSDIAYTTSTTQLSANWDASSDAQSGISGYQYAIGTSAGGTQTLNWTSLGNVTTVTKTVLSLTNGQTYYFSVKAVNGVGLTGTATNSNGQTVDSTAPSAPPTVRDGTGADISTTSSTTQLSANWDASTDNESGISGYQFAIGTSAGGTQTLNWTSLGNVTTVTKNGLTLTVGQTYFFSVKAVNGVGLTGSATNSNGQTVVSGGSSATTVDVYQDMENGNSGDLLTATIMNASSHPSGTAWSAPSGSLWVSTSKHSDLPGPVVVGGVTYNGTGGTRAWVYNNNNASNYVTYGGTARPKLTVACYYTTNTTIRNTTSYGTIGLSGLAGIWTMMINGNSDSAGPYLSLSSKDSSGAVVGSSGIKITAGKTYWVNLKYDGAAYASSLAVFDPASSFAQVGSTATVGSGSDSMFAVKFGRVDNNGNLTAETTQSWFDQILIDWTNAAFPLIPSAGTDSTPPSAPANVRDGTGTDISTTSSTTQLLANWDASTDAESGISGYQFAIGTTAGGTQTVNWTSLGNFTTVTKTGLTLSVGQTYYFGVRAVNGAGLTGSATNSNGQTVVSGATTYFQDSFDSWAVHGGAWSSVNGENANHTLNTSTDQARSGTKSLKLTDSDTTSTSGAYLTKTFSPVISGDIYVRFYVFLPTGYGSTNVNCNRRVLQVYCGSNRGMMTLITDTPDVEEVGAWGNIQSPTALSENAWHCLELHITAPSASTTLEFWVDGVKNTATLSANFSASSTWDHINFGDDATGSSGTNGTGTWYFDEIVVSNSYIGTLP